MFRVKPDLEKYRSLIRERPCEIIALNKFSTDLFKEQSPSKVARSVLHHLANLIPIKTAYILVYDQTEKCLKVKGFVGLSADEAKKIKIRLLRSPIGTCAKNQKPLFIEDASSSRFRKTIGGANSFLILPIRIGEDGLGAIVAWTKKSVKFDIFAREILKIFASQAAQALNNAFLKENLQHEIDERRRAESELENRVKERTVELSKANQALRESEGLYKTLVETDPDAITVTDLKGRITHVSARAVELYGYKKAEDLIGGNFFKLIIAKDQKKVKKSFQSAIKKGALRNLEYTFLRKDGTFFTGGLSASVIKDALGKPKAFIGTVRDITERRKAEEELIKLSSAVEQADDNIFITNRDGVIEYVNPSFEKLTGYTKEEAIGKTPRILKSGKHDKDFYRRLWKTVGSGKVFHDILINRRKNGELYYEEKTITPIRDNSGKIVYFVSTGNDITARKLAEEALRASEKKYATLVERGNDGIVIIQDGVFKFVNPIIAKMTGRPKEEALGKPFTDFVSPDHRKLVLERYKKRLRGERVQQKYEIDILAKDGSKIPVEINASVIEHEGRVADMAIIRDITNRKETEDRLASEEEKMSAIFNTTTEGLALYDHEGRIVDVNPAFKKLFGMKKKPIGVGRMEIIQNRNKFYKYKVERDDNPSETQSKVYSGKPVSHVLIKIHSRPARYLEGNYVPIKDQGGRVVGMSASFRDVTALKTQAEKIARQLSEVDRQRNRWRAIFENVEEGILIIDKELRIVVANSAVELMADNTQAEMVGKKYYEVLGCHDRFGHHYPEFNPIAKVLATREAIPYDEHLHTDKNNQEHWVGVSYTPIFNEGGQIEQIVGVIRDITAIKELERSKSDFVSVASHELRTPLTVVNGYLSLLLGGDLGGFGDPNAQERLQPVLEKLYNETNRLTKMVEDLLNVSRIEDGRIKLVLRKVSLVETIDEVVREFKVLAAERKIKLLVKDNLNKEADRFFVTADKDKLKQILVNLLDNAIKYNRSGGRVSVGCYLKEGRLYTEVRDTGVGIPTAVLPRIFEKFQQGRSNSYLKENKGTGLGLFVVKSLVELQGGKIWVDSKIGKGTKFTFTLPTVAGG